MNEITAYQQIIQDVRQRMTQITENFVYIGWQLKRLISSGMMQQAGYESIEELGAAEFGINKDDTYRFIRINNKYSVDGDSPELDVRFKGIGQSKLSEMLNLPAADLELINQNTRREDIRELNRFNRQEPELDPAAGGDLQNIIREFFKPGRSGAQEMLLELLDILDGKKQNDVLTKEEQIQECINSKGSSTFRSGRYFVFMYEAREGMKYKVFGSNENHPVSYLEFAKMVHLMFVTANKNEDGMDAWENMYGRMPEPKVIEPPVAIEEPKTKPELKPTPKLEPAPVQEPEPEPEEEEKTRVNTGQGRNPAEVVVNVEKPVESRMEEKSYPHKNDENGGLAPAQLKPSEDGKDEQSDALFILRKEAEEYLANIQDGLKDNEYFMARIETKHLLDTLNEIIEAMEQKQLPGQGRMELGEV